MKTIGIVTDGYSDLGMFINENLRMVLGNNVEIHNHYIKELHGKAQFTEDLVLVMINKKIDEIARHLSGKDNVVVLERTILLTSYYQLLEIPAGVDVLVVNDSDETSMDTVRLLQALGITHIRLIPYVAGNSYGWIRLAVTPGEARYVPNYVAEVIDIGNRYIDLSTFFTIITRLSLDKEEINLRLKRYLELIMSVYSPVKGMCMENFVKKQELNTLLELSNDGILLTDKDGNIRVGNRKLGEFLGIQDFVGRNIQNVFPQKWFMQVGTEESLENSVLSLGQKVFNLNKEVLRYYEVTYGYYYHFQELTYIRQLEQCLSKKLRSSGHIARYTFTDIVSKSPVMKKTIDICRRIAKTDLTVLLVGESGTGKELIAQSIHNASNRKNAPFIAINSAAMPEHLLESELFGYEEGAFTGAAKGGKMGLILQANHGTVFLDEIGDMPIHLQTKLLRVLQEKQVMSIGSGQIVDIDVRFIFATNHNLQAMMEENRFRVDLLYRINTCQIKLPPLRERREDVLAIAESFMGDEYRMDDAVAEVLHQYAYKGNIRELMNILSYSKALCAGNILHTTDLPDYVLGDAYRPPVRKRRDFNARMMEVLQVLETNGSMGRQGLLKSVDGEYDDWSEAEMKKTLAELKRQSLIESGPGRSGSFITVEGMNRLRAGRLLKVDLI